MSRRKIGEDSPIPILIYLKIRRRDGVESLTTLEESEFKVPIDGCINEWKGKKRKILQRGEEIKFCIKVREGRLHK